MEKINDVWIHAGKEYEVVPGPCVECAGYSRPLCGWELGGRCRSLIGHDHVFKLKENKMIKSFKCAGMTFSRVVKMKEALIARLPDLLSFPDVCNSRAAFIYYSNTTLEFSDSGSAKHFVASSIEEMIFDQAMKMIEAVSVAKPAPVFDFRPFHKVLRKHNCTETWSLGLFSHIGHDAFIGLNNANLSCMIHYEDNERLLNTTTRPDGWWEVKEGKPVWRVK